MFGVVFCFCFFYLWSPVFSHETPGSRRCCGTLKPSPYPFQPIDHRLYHAGVVSHVVLVGVRGRRHTFAGIVDLHTGSMPAASVKVFIFYLNRRDSSYVVSALIAESGIKLMVRYTR